MTRILTTALAALLVACGGAGQPAGQADMPGMPGMAATSGTSDMSSMPGMDMAGDRPMTLTARQASVGGITVAVAREAPLDRTVRAVAMAVPNERGLGVVSARVTGWVESLQANETGRFVRRGDPLLALYAPEFVTAQEELLLARGMGPVPGGDSLVVAARRRLALWGIGDEQIADIERSGTVRRRLTIQAPQSGYILEKAVVAGQMVRPGEALFRLADLSTVWVEPAIFESDIRFVRVGQRAEVTFDALPGERFMGRVTFLHPTLDMQTRTLRVRVEVPNPHMRIKPMMFGTVRLATEGPRGVTVPLGAVLPTGVRELAFVVRQGGVVPVEVTVAARGDSAVLVSDGLAVGDTVVASAAFLFDSESQLGAAMAGIMLNMGMGLDMGGMRQEGGAADMPGMKMDAGRSPVPPRVLPRDGEAKP